MIWRRYPRGQLLQKGLDVSKTGFYLINLSFTARIYS